MRLSWPAGGNEKLALLLSDTPFISVAVLETPSVSGMKGRTGDFLSALPKLGHAIP